jgi:hypothetical protein
MHSYIKRMVILLNKMVIRHKEDLGGRKEDMGGRKEDIMLLGHRWDMEGIHNSDRWVISNRVHMVGDIMGKEGIMGDRREAMRVIGGGEAGLWRRCWLV